MLQKHGTAIKSELSTRNSGSWTVRVKLISALTSKRFVSLPLPCPAGSTWTVSFVCLWQAESGVGEGTSRPLGRGDEFTGSFDEHRESIGSSPALPPRSAGPAPIRPSGRRWGVKKRCCCCDKKQYHRGSRPGEGEALLPPKTGAGVGSTAIDTMGPEQASERRRSIRSSSPPPAIPSRIFGSRWGLATNLDSALPAGNRRLGQTRISSPVDQWRGETRTWPARIEASVSWVLAGRPTGSLTVRTRKQYC